MPSSATTRARRRCSASRMAAGTPRLPAACRRAAPAAQVAERLAAGEAWDDWDLVWCKPNGRPVDPHDDWEEWKGLLRDANVAKNLASTTLATQPPRSSLSKA